MDFTGIIRLAFGIALAFQLAFRFTFYDFLETFFFPGVHASPFPLLHLSGPTRPFVVASVRFGL